MGITDRLIPPPHRVNRGNLTRPGGIERAVTAQAHRVSGRGGILVLIDADDDCPATFGPHLLHRARAARPDRKIAVVLANKELEAWYLAAVDSLVSAGVLTPGTRPPAQAEGVRDAKGWLSERMEPGGYRPTIDQERFAARLDLTMARRNAASFDKLCRDIAYLISDQPAPG